MRATCLYVATKLGDLLDELVVVGGLVPSLLIDQTAKGGDLHAGTADLDLGLTLAILDNQRYAELAERLRSAGFGPDRAHGKPVPHRWVIDAPSRVTVDFLIPPARVADVPGEKRVLEDELSAIVTPGLPLALADPERIQIDGLTIHGERASRELKVCGAAAFVLMKGLAVRLRGENKDAYDLVYVLRNLPAGIEAIAERAKPLLADAQAVSAVGYLRQDFADLDGVGPMRAAEFVGNREDEELRADAVGLVTRFLAGLPAKKG